ncbi:Protein CBR-GGR-2 [Aphelenchoides bicaudatus]|nr:Protein CBR-GGR-2 [Aphelenchoides bicaudatus]
MCPTAIWKLGLRETTVNYFITRVFVFYGLFVLTASTDSRSVPMPIWLEERLSAGRAVYDKQSTPTQLEGTPTNVQLSMYIEGISSFRTQTMDFQLDVYFQQYWNDSRLAHNESRRILIRDSDILKKIWRPDVYFANSRTAQFHDVTQDNFLLWIEPDGSVLYDTRVSMVVICAMQLHHYPLDSQWCNLRMLSYAYDVNQLIIKWIDVDAITRNPNITLPDMHIARLEPGICDGNYSTGVWSCVTAEFFVSREITHHIMQTYVPTSLIVIISWFSFWLGLDNEAVPARVSLAITTLLTLSTQANSVRTTLPEVSYMRSIDIFLTISVLFVFGVMIEFVVTNYTQRKAMEEILARMAGEAAAKNKAAGNVETKKEKTKKIGNRARNLLGRMFRTGTELRNLLEPHDMNGDGPPQHDNIPLRQQRSATADVTEKPPYWASGSPQSGGDDGSSIGSWNSLRHQRNRIVAHVSLANGQPQSLISSQQPPGYDQAERLANWTKPELSCDDFVENRAAPTATPMNTPPTWPIRNAIDPRIKALVGNAQVEEGALGGVEPSSPRSQGTHNSGSLRWANVVRQIQKKKEAELARSDYGKLQAKKIDEWSRWAFPLSYLAFHIFYW